jgi:hypothetical protein
MCLEWWGRCSGQRGPIIASLSMFRIYTSEVETYIELGRGHRVCISSTCCASGMIVSIGSCDCVVTSIVIAHLTCSIHTVVVLGANNGRRGEPVPTTTQEPEDQSCNKCKTNNSTNDSTRNGTRVGTSSSSRRVGGCASVSGTAGGA